MANELYKPLYVQIQEYLAEQIFSGRLPPDSRLPSERDLSEELGVSRMTVRRAITELVNDGLLERRHGSGTYVAKPKVLYDARELIDHAESMRRRGLAYTSQLLEFIQVPASKRLAEILHVDVGHLLYRVVKLHLANRIPTVVESSFVPCSCCPDLEEYDLEKVSIYDVLVQRYHLPITHIAQTVEADIARDEVAQQLRVEPGAPLLRITRIMYHEKDKPIQYSRDLVRGDYVRIQTEFDL